MGTLTLSELKSEVKAALGNRSDLDSRLTTLINLTQDRLSRLHEFDEMETSGSLAFPCTGTITDKTIVLPNLREVYSVIVYDGMSSQKLQYMLPRQFDKAIPKADEFTRRRPEFYTTWNNSIEVFPLPDKAYSGLVRYTKWPAAMSDSAPSATSEFNRKDEILIELTVALAYRSLGKLDEAQQRFQMITDQLLLAMNEDKNKPDQSIAPAMEQLRSAFSGDQYWNNPFMSSAP